VAFLHKIRDEMKFSGLPALQAQIEKDVAVAKELFEIRHD
jgi:riboflavin kinase/FMN adenylyltransferase